MPALFSEAILEQAIIDKFIAEGYDYVSGDDSSVLAVYTTQGASGRENGSGSVLPGDAGFFPLVQGDSCH